MGHACQHGDICTREFGAILVYEIALQIFISLIRSTLHHFVIRRWGKLEVGKSAAASRQPIGSQILSSPSRQVNFSAQSALGSQKKDTIGSHNSSHPVSRQSSSSPKFFPSQSVRKMSHPLGSQISSHPVGSQEITLGRQPKTSPT